jgi:hypothetical protein
MCRFIVMVMDELLMRGENHAARMCALSKGAVLRIVGGLRTLWESHTLVFSPILAPILHLKLFGVRRSVRLLSAHKYVHDDGARWFSR